MSFTKNCPQCGKEQKYKSERCLNRAIRNNNSCKSCSQKGKKMPPFSEEHRRKLSEAHTGITHTEETRRKLSESNTGKTLSEEHIRKISEAHTGKTLSEEHRRNMSIAKGGDGTLDKGRFSHYKLRNWSKQVRKKDNKRCVYCGSTKKLHSHHILSKAKHPEWALFIDNGITLCEPCHIEEHKLNGLI